MKKVFVLGVIFILLTSFVSAESPFKIIATVPPFVRPGDENVTIQLTVKLESGEYDDVKVELILPKFFSASKQDSDTFNLGDMSTTDILKPPMGVCVFQVDISPDATYGDYTVQAYIRTKSGSFLDRFTMHVVGETLIEITQVASSEEPVEPGHDFQLDITVKNIGSNAVKWIKIILSPNPGTQAEMSVQSVSQLSQATSPQESTVIIPISSDLERVFKDVGPGKSVTATYALSVGIDAESKNYAMTVSLVYQDETGMVNSETRTIGIKIQGKPSLELQGIEVDPSAPYQGEEAVISITLENNGTGDARSVKVDLSSVLGKYTSFIGTMKRNENNAAVFKILIPTEQEKFPEHLLNNLLNKTQTHTYPLTIQVYYEDTEGSPQGFAESWDLMTRAKYEKTIFYVMGGAVIIIVMAVWRLQSRRQLKALEEE
ncbi:MAG: hypothetical protein HXS41_05280 [Theionarchaea archaeon]|nr:hypothetical protein [Theionarchaea archaeon]MBU7001803.1 hypothetical protein [Theionarchaea archaeon]MBU7020448.1 hypothetical protein [Theionarchaea archaeon]MBU7034773.1 hypothetical protein [Theionarchaea archaeon]